MKNFIKTCITDGDTYNWQSMIVDPFKITDSSDFDIEEEILGENKFPNMKVLTYMSLIKDGVKFPPVVITKDYVVMDGTHRVAIYRKLKKKIWVLKQLGKGNGKVSGKWTGKSTYPFLKAEIQMNCINCGYPLLHQGVSDKLGPISAIPNGLPSGELWACKKCGLYFNRKSVIWQE